MRYRGRNWILVVMSSVLGAEKTTVLGAEKTTVLGTLELRTANSSGSYGDYGFSVSQGRWKGWVVCLFGLLQGHDRLHKGL